jgi:hypothetical protein
VKRAGAAQGGRDVISEMGCECGEAVASEEEGNNRDRSQHDMDELQMN